MTIKSTIAIVSPRYGKNHVLNPSGEGTGNYSAVDTAVVSIATNGIQKYGLSSYSIQMMANGDGLQLTLLALEDYPHYFTARLRTLTQTVSVTFRIGSTNKTPVLLEKIDEEWSLYGATFSAAEANGQTTARITLSAPPGGQPGIWADGIQVEPMINEPFVSGGVPMYSTFIDGTQPGCRWLGAPHASASTRSADSRAGGLVKDFWQGYGFFPERVLGAGAAIEDLNIDSYAFLPGGELNSSKIRPREFTIIGFFLGNTKEDLHAKAQALELELGLDTYPGRQPIRIRYYGAVVQKEISAHYAGGLEGELPIFYNDDFSVEDEKWMRNYKFRMKASIQFIATDPFWYEVGESATLLDTNDDDTFRIVAARLMETGQWSSLGPPGAGGTYTAEGPKMAEDDTYVYFANNFNNFDGIANADKIVRYNKQTGVYSALGTGANQFIEAIILGPDGLLYAGGAFTSIGGVAADYAAYWDGSSWNAMPGLDQPVTRFAFSPDGFLYQGGQSTAPLTVSYWDGAAWNGIAGTGVNGSIQAMAFDRSGLLYMGGAFTTVDGVTVNRLATWDGTDWAMVGSGMNGSVFAIAISLNGLVYVGGNFTTAGGVAASRVAYWNGSVFTPLGDGVDGDVKAIAIGPDGMIYIGGDFDTAGDVALANKVTKWNGYTFAHLDIDLPGDPEVQQIKIGLDIDPVILDNYTLYLGFTTTGTGAYAGLVTADNDGSISAFPKIIFSRSGGTGATIQTLRNERTGRELLFNYALLDGETLTIDLNPKNRTIVSSFFGSRMDARLKNDDFSVWQLLPGGNDVTAFVSEDGSPTVTGYILYRTPYRSWN